MSNQRRTAVGQGSSHGQLFAVGGQYLSGTTPNRPNLIIYDTSDWSVWDSKICGASETNIVNSIAEDENYIYIANDTAPYFQVYNKSTKSFLSGVATLTLVQRGIYVDDTHVYCHSQATLNKFAKSNFSAFSSVSSFSQTNAISGDNTMIYGMTFAPNPDQYVRVNKSTMSAGTNISVSGSNVTNTSLHSCVNDDTMVYYGCYNATDTNNRFLVYLKGSSSTLSAQYTTASTYIYAMTQDTDYVYFGVSNGEFRRVVKSTLVIENTAQTFSAAIRCMLNLGDTIAVGGDFTDKFKLVPKSNLATTVSGTPALAGTVRSLCLIS